ncbi:c-type cytochrome biogenesis protein CcsB [Stackebrandtia nassauensis]|uniref:Cytochrome c-type biogenesis protein CcsB n=1 Tax=Stackebrandtia nassauensis (strain DSM 44728 / CIP 108903 / NRRL B-16338 / NBRC 102104 / LLR-40K-21) TaxID=446470 RepID=D3Q831_STANL|nr:c-type cytochrome biogenesis protein CcsB [Stackebrandtia nassauensis]ADD40536.1 cytochrome c-type biogenesis protein CcsB [Stackebrandtia nassauensis DSM 44728]
MPSSSGLADASNAAFVITIVLYAVAMFGYAVEYAFGRREAKAAEHRQLAAVGAGGEFTVPGEYADKSADGAFESHLSIELDEDDSDEDEDDSRPQQPGVTSKQALAAGRIGFVAMVLAAVAHTASLGLRAAAVGRWPWGNMFEFIVAVALVGVIVWIVLVGRGTVSRRLGLFTMLAVVLLLGSATRVYTDAAPLVPALDSYWIAIHVFAAIIATGVFLVGFVAAVLHLLKRGYDRKTAAGQPIRFPFTIAQRLPLAEKLEKLTWRMHVLAFPLWTFGVIAGAIWAREAWSRYWGWDPKEVWAFIAWVVYAAYLHARNTGSTGRTLAPWIVIIGWAVMLFNLFGVNLVVNSLHSYAGV